MDAPSSLSLQVRSLTVFTKSHFICHEFSYSWHHALPFLIIVTNSHSSKLALCIYSWLDMAIFLPLSPFYPPLYYVICPIVSSSSLYAFCVRGQQYATLLYVNRVIQQSKSLICIQINRYSIPLKTLSLHFTTGMTHVPVNCVSGVSSCHLPPRSMQHVNYLHCVSPSISLQCHLLLTGLED